LLAGETAGAFDVVVPLLVGWLWMCWVEKNLKG
jgi:hypothetical protein